jgi:hypothetical protein
VIFSWDAHIVPRDREHFAFISHDELARVLVKDDGAQEMMLAKLKDGIRKFGQFRVGREEGTRPRLTRGS